jgi:hypothetical protein
MTNPADLQDPENWTGGCYELEIELGHRDDARLRTALREMWRLAAVEGCLSRHDLRPFSFTSDALPDGGAFCGVVRLPTRHPIVCIGGTVREENGPDWLSLGLPLGALARLDPRVRGFPFPPDDDGSLTWRRDIDDWLAEIAQNLFHAVPFPLGLIGVEVSGTVRTSDVFLQEYPPSDAADTSSRQGNSSSIRPPPADATTSP